MAFRFFVNADKCLNMNNFDFFFYQKQSRRELHLAPDVHIGVGTGLSFRKAASDIRMYLDRFPYNVHDYQIIIAMRSNFRQYASTWRETLLSRLLDIDFDLRQSNILIRSGLGRQVAVNLIMIYEASVVRELHTIDDPYMGSDRFHHDCLLLLQEIGVPKGKEDDLDAVKAAWNQYIKSHTNQFQRGSLQRDGRIANSLRAFFTDLIQRCEERRKETEGASSNVSTLYALKEILGGYQIFELITDSQNRDKEINTLLRVVEFVTTDYNAAVGMDSVTQLTETCAAHWKQIIKTDNGKIQNKYAKMLSNYRERLSAYIANSESSYLTSDTESTLPESIVPSDDEISVVDSIFESEKRSNDVDPKALVSDFKNKLFPVNTLPDRWKWTYEQISRVFSRLEESLKEYSNTLWQNYAQILEKRKKEERVWHNGAYVESISTKQEIRDLSDEESSLLIKMNQPQMTPSLSFQDQLNMETALEQKNQSIRHYIKCMQAVSGKGFILLIILVLGVVTLLYGILQSYNFESTTTAMYHVGYIGLSFILMLFTWKLPLNYYEKKVQSCLSELEREMDKYIKGYYDRAKQIHEYINLVNKLDYIGRHLRLKKKAVKTTEWIIKARTWHINQAKHHIEKLGFFDGLTGTYKTSQSFDESINNGLENEPTISRDHVDDVIDNKLYWPQT